MRCIEDLALVKALVYRGLILIVSFIVLHFMGETSGHAIEIALVNNVIATITYYLFEKFCDTLKYSRGTLWYIIKSVIWRVSGVMVSMISVVVVGGSSVEAGVYAVSLNIICIFTYFFFDIFWDKVIIKRV